MSVDGRRRNIFILFSQSPDEALRPEDDASIRDPATGIVHHDPFEILGVW